VCQLAEIPSRPVILLAPVAWVVAMYSKPPSRLDAERIDRSPNAFSRRAAQFVTS